MWLFLSVCLNAMDGIWLDQAFPTGQDSAPFWEKGTKNPLLTRDNGTSSKSYQGTERAGTACQNPGRTGTAVGVCLRIFAPALVTPGQENFFVLGQRNNRTWKR